MGRTWRGYQRANRGQKRRKANGQAAVNLGRYLETRVENILRQMTEAGLLDSFMRHNPYSDGDRSGKDFTIVRGGVTRDLGITCSYKHWKESYARYAPAISVLHIRLESSDSEIAEKVLSLFETSDV